MNDVLNHHNQKDRPEPEEEVEQAPVLGLLSQTVIQSPLAHWILPARMRSMVNNDVAFIGVSEGLKMGSYSTTCLR